MQKEKRTLMSKVLRWIEIGGNALPHPATLFGGLAVLVLIFSWIGGYLFDWTATHPATG